MIKISLKEMCGRMNSKAKFTDTFIYVMAFIVTSYVQDVLFQFNLFSVDNLFFDFLSWVTIHTVQRTSIYF